LLISHVSFAGDLSCENLFGSSKFESLSHIEEKYNVSIKKKPRNFLSTYPLSPEAKTAAGDIYQLTRFHGDLSEKLEDRKLKLTESEILELADQFFLLSERSLKLTGTKYSTKTFMFHGKRKSYFVISSGNNTPLNKLATNLKKQYGVRAIYNPYELVDISAGAIYDDKNKTLYLSETQVATATANDYDFVHENVHMQAALARDQGRDYVFSGSVGIDITQLPGKFNSTYSNFLSFEEIDAYFAETVKITEQMQEIIDTQELSEADRGVLFGRYKATILSTLKTFHELSAKIFMVTNQSLEDMKVSTSPLSFDKSQKLIEVRWKEKDNKDRYYYDASLFIPKVEGASREDLVKMTIQRINQIRMLARYYGNLAAVGKMFFNKKLSQDEMEVAIQQFKKIFVPQRNFQSLSNVPTQQDLISEMLENDPN
jgi:hypothetical protein